MSSLLMQAYEAAITTDEMKDYTPMSSEQMLSMLSDFGISLECDDQEQWEQCESKFNGLVANLHSLNHLRELTQSKGEVNRFTMESVGAIAPTAIHDHYPPSTYTTSMSGHQLDQSMEAIDLATVLTVAAAVTAVAIAFYVLYKMLTSDGLSGSVNTLEANGRKLKAAEDKLDTMVSKKQEEIQGDPAKTTEFNKIISNDIQYLGLSVGGPSQRAGRFIRDLKPAGLTYKAFVKVNSQIEVAVDNFTQAFKKLEDLMKAYYNAKPSQSNYIRKQIAGVRKLLKTKLGEDILTVSKLFMEHVGEDSNGASFIETEVLPSRDFYDMYTEPNAAWMEDWRRLIPDNLERLDTKLASLRKTADGVKAIEEKVKKDTQNAKLHKAADSGGAYEPTVVDPQVAVEFNNLKAELMRTVKQFIEYRRMNRMVVNVINEAMRRRRDFFMTKHNKLKFL